MKLTRRTIKAIIKEIVQVPTPTFPDKYVHKVEEEVTEEILENMISVLPLWEAGEYEQVETLIQDMHSMGKNQIHTLMIAAEEMKNYGQINDHAPEWVTDYFAEKFWGEQPIQELKESVEGES